MCMTHACFCEGLSCSVLSLAPGNIYCALQPPFNEAARAAAGFGPDWYLPLSTEFLN